MIDPKFDSGQVGVLYNTKLNRVCLLPTENYQLKRKGKVRFQIVFLKFSAKIRINFKDLCKL